MKMITENWKLVIAGISLIILMLGQTAYVSGRFARSETRIEHNEKMIETKAGQYAIDRVRDDLKEIKEIIKEMDVKLDNHILYTDQK